MTCQLCGNRIPDHGLDYTVYQQHEGKDVDLNVCGRCFILTDILKTLKEIKDGKPR